MTAEVLVPTARLSLAELANVWVDEPAAPFQIALAGQFDATPFLRDDGTVDENRHHLRRRLAPTGTTSSWPTCDPPAETRRGPRPRSRSLESRKAGCRRAGPRSPIRGTPLDQASHPQRDQWFRTVGQSPRPGPTSAVGCSIRRRRSAPKRVAGAPSTTLWSTVTVRSRTSRTAIWSPMTRGRRLNPPTTTSSEASVGGARAKPPPAANIPTAVTCTVPASSWARTERPI